MLKKGRALVLSCVLSVVALPTLPLLSAQAQTEEIIENIEIRGTRRVPQDTVKFHIVSQKNTRFDPQVLRRDFKAIWAQGFFDDLRVTLEDGKTGKIIIFTVKEKPLIRNIEYKGLKSATNTSSIVSFFVGTSIYFSGLGPFGPPRKIRRPFGVVKSTSG